MGLMIYQINILDNPHLPCKLFEISDKSLDIFDIYEDVHKNQNFRY